MEIDRRLYRSAERRMVGGVAVGLADYFRVDPLIIRLLFAAGLFFGGATLLAYLVMWICIPRDPESEPWQPGFLTTALKALSIVACVAIIASQFESEFWIGGFAIGLCIGLYFYWRSKRGDAYDEDPVEESCSRRKFYRSTSDKKILGVFGGLAASMKVDPTLLRVIGVVLLVTGFPVTVVLYLLAALLMPKPSIVIHLE